VNANATVATLAMTIGVSTTSINNALKKLKEKALIKRVGSNKTGFWEIL
jgi:ATP-dependent DNA helicase RecG